MKRYIGTKVIRAELMSRLDYNNLRGWNLPDDENGFDEGYLVEYSEGGKPNLEGYAGYISWSPKEQFDNAYRGTDGMSFGLAIEAIKKGMKVARIKWLGQNKFIYLVPSAVYKTQTAIAREVFGEEVNYRAYIAYKTPQDDVGIYTPSTCDVLADDWTEFRLK